MNRDEAMPIEAVLTGRKPGRPRKFAQGRINATTRFRPALYATLRDQARANGRSFSEEIEFRIEKTILEEGVLGEIRRGLDKVSDETRDIMAELLEQYRTRIEELQQRIADLERERPFNEGRLTQIVETAITRALGENK
jgi:BMFP domain-containing protein YqiC